MDGNLAMNSHFENMSEKDNNAAYEEGFIKSGNQIISFFMGAHFCSSSIRPNGSISSYKYKYNSIEFEWNGIGYYDNGLKFHLSWDWIMPVINRIEDLGWTFLIQKGIAHIINDKLPFNDLEFANKSNNNQVDKLFLTFRTVLDFVEWYNAKIKDTRPI